MSCRLYGMENVSVKGEAASKKQDRVVVSMLSFEETGI
jgi:hypothetical protein